MPRKRSGFDFSAVLGRTARINAGIRVATMEDLRRTVHVAQERKRYLDKDGLYASAKPIIDGLKTTLRRKVGRKFETYNGAGLIFDDSPKYCDWEVTQEITRDEPQVWITVEIPEGEA